MTWMVMMMMAIVAVVVVLVSDESHGGSVYGSNPIANTVVAVDDNILIISIHTDGWMDGW